MTRIETIQCYNQLFHQAAKDGTIDLVRRELDLTDLFFLLVYTLNRPDANNDWVFARCREVQQNPDGFLDLWFREGYKSTIGTFAQLIQDILNFPELTNCIISFNNPIARRFLRPIMREFEMNIALRRAHEDVLYWDPRKESPKWSEQEGIIVKRTGNPKECTLEAYGLTDNLPTSAHYSGVIIFDDMEDPNQVPTPTMIKKVTDAWEQALNIGQTERKEQGITASAFRYRGTRCHYADTYSEIISRGAAIPRVYTPTDDGTPTGNPVLWTREILEKKMCEMGPYTAASQLWQNPKMADAMGFEEAWLRYWQPVSFQEMNLYIIVDPAAKKKKRSDYSSFFVIGLGSDRNYYIIRIVRDRLNLTERSRVLFSLHQQYNPVGVGYEEYGLQADIEHHQEQMERDNYRFTIVPLHRTLSKEDRILTLVPLFEQGRIYLPHNMPYVNYEHKAQDLVKIFIEEEYKAYPYCAHDDMIDCLSLITDPKLGAAFPNREKIFFDKEPEYDPLRY